MIISMVKPIKVNLSKENSERVLSGAKWIANLVQGYFASLNNNSIKPTSSGKKLIDAFLLVPIIVPTAITVAWGVCTYFLLDAVSIQKNNSLLSKIAKFTAKIFIYIAAAMILIPCIISNVVISLIPALIFYCINRDFLHQKNTSIENQAADTMNDEEYKKRIEEEVGELEQQNIAEPTTEVISRTVEGIDRTIIVGIVNDDIKDGKGVIRTVEDDLNVAIKGIIAAGETEGYAVGFGLQCSLTEEGGVDLQCGLSTRIGSNKKQAIERLGESESARTLLSGDSGILSIEQLSSSQQK
ncbi:hypothetical protein [Wolbachia endosymbiont (group A) of Sphaerophoria taeniata]|uniref:hypothetical protein n=1 Tax=Wolbachia endosymbiont (group A) of Sphaerophoria taeniata TaxID=2954057 RepID=UPI002226EF30|nr:hypothetical protein [Wolbachia endosymbiont (group A) of Sphaerophoria taeniata]